MKPLSLSPEADEEIRHTFDWYESQREMLGLRFVDALDELLDRVRQNPSQYPRIGTRGARRALVPGFPYAVVYLELPEVIRVLAIAHGKRQPEYWRHRR